MNDHIDPPDAEALPKLTPADFDDLLSRIDQFEEAKEISAE